MEASNNRVTYKKGLICSRCGKPINHDSGGVSINGEPPICRAICFQIVNDEKPRRSDNRYIAPKSSFAI